MSGLFAQMDFIGMLQRVLPVLLVLLIGWLLLRVARVLMRRLRARLLRISERTRETSAEAQRRVETLVRLLDQAVAVFLYCTLGLVLLMQLGVQVGPLVASAGILGIAFGFGAQSLVKDLITGFFFVLENQIRVGDVAVINGTGGLVEAMTLRTLVLRDEAGVVHVIPNGAVNTLSNMTRDWSAYVFNIGIGHRSDPDEAIELLRETASAMRREPEYAFKIIEEPEVFGVDKLDEFAVVIRGRIKTRPIMQWQVGREFLRRVKKAFDRRGIELPFPRGAFTLLPPAAEKRVQPQRAQRTLRG